VARRDVEHANPEPAAAGLFEIGEAHSDIFGIRPRPSVPAREKRSGENTTKEKSAT
jgi:hypothetical protein